jgi:hypothetical protein
MRLLNSQEVAVERARRKHELLSQYNNLVEQLDKKNNDILEIQAALEKLKGEILIHINKYEH